MSVQLSTQTAIDESANRLVWVLNKNDKPYHAEFKGMKLVIPAMYEKIPKRAKEGGNLMPYLEACAFVRDYKCKQPHLIGKADEYGPKMLFEAELTEDEFNRIVKKTPMQLRTEKASEEKKAKEAHKTYVAKVTRKTLAEDE